MLTSNKHIKVFRLMTLKQRLKLEMKGLKFRGRTSYSIIKEEFELKGSRQKVLDQFAEIIKQEVENVS